MDWLVISLGDITDQMDRVDTKKEAGMMRAYKVINNGILMLADQITCFLI